MLVVGLPVAEALCAPDFVVLAEEVEDDVLHRVVLRVCVRVTVEVTECVEDTEMLREVEEDWLGDREREGLALTVPVRLGLAEPLEQREGEELVLEEPHTVTVEVEDTEKLGEEEVVTVVVAVVVAVMVGVRVPLGLALKEGVTEPQALREGEREPLPVLDLVRWEVEDME